MALVDEALKYLKGKRVVVVTNVESEGYLQEVVGVLLDGAQDCLIVLEGEDESPTVINAAHVAWIYEEASDEEEEEQEEEE